MIKFILTLFVSLLAINAQGQIADSLFIKANYGSDHSDVRLLMEIDKVDYYKIRIQNSSHKKLCIFLTTKEYWNGKITRIDTLLPLEYAKQMFDLKEIDTNAVFSLLTKPVKDSVSFLYTFNGASLKRKYSRVSSEFYSLRDGLATGERYKKIPFDQSIPLFVYSLPYEDPKRPNYLLYCALTADGVPPDQWWEKYRIRHFIVVEMKIVTG